MNSLTLYDIESGLLELLTYREEMFLREHRPGEAEKDMEELKAIDSQIEAYVQRELVKVDGIAYYLKEFEAHEEILAREIEKLQIKRDTWARRRDDLKAMVAGVMQAAGKTKLQGATHTLSLRNNPASVDVQQPELVPNEYRRITVKCTAEQWRGIVAVLMSSQERTPADVEASRRILASLDISEPVPMKVEIREQLIHLLPAVERLAKARAAHADSGHDPTADSAECKDCQDIAWMESQLQLDGVPGCSLVTDKKTLVVK